MISYGWSVKVIFNGESTAALPGHRGNQRQTTGQTTPKTAGSLRKSNLKPIQKLTCFFYGKKIRFFRIAISCAEANGVFFLAFWMHPKHQDIIRELEFRKGRRQMPRWRHVIFQQIWVENPPDWKNSGWNSNAGGGIKFSKQKYLEEAVIQEGFFCYWWSCFNLRPPFYLFSCHKSSTAWEQHHGILSKQIKTSKDCFYFFRYLSIYLSIYIYLYIFLFEQKHILTPPLPPPKKKKQPAQKQITQQKWSCGFFGWNFSGWRIRQKTYPRHWWMRCNKFSGLCPLSKITWQHTGPRATTTIRLLPSPKKSRAPLSLDMSHEWLKHESLRFHGAEKLWLKKFPTHRWLLSMSQ